MNKKMLMVPVLLLGVYFVLFHSPPFPMSHDEIGLPPFHVVHTLFGVALLVGAFYFGKKK